MRPRRRAALFAAAAALIAAPGVAAVQAAAAAVPGPGWHHVQDFAPEDLGGCHTRGQWYLENGANRYECRPAGVWQLWVLTDG
ncbi:hypothetical protein ACFRCG_19010 [Embleya sp. NPDC056575]|uniref:hypothetical protein n=1 Tax=unclassified Embleya TaxID=2699296 RepID=UPI0036CC5625